MKKFLIFVSILFLISVNSVFAQNIQTITDIATNVFGIPQEWLTVQKIIFNVIIPFIAIMAVSLGMLKQLRIFPRSTNIEILLAFVMAFSTLPTKAFVVFVGWSLAAMGIWAYIIFFLLFIVGSTIFGFMRGKGYVAEYKASVDVYNTIQKELQDVRDRRVDLNKHLITMPPDEYAKKMDSLIKQDQKLKEKLRAWQEHN